MKRKKTGLDVVVPGGMTREEIFAHYLEQGGPKNDAELHWWVKEYLRVDIPRNAVCRGHVSPFKYVADQFFGRVTETFALMPRVGLELTYTAVLNALDLLFKPEVQILVVGAVRRNAQASLEVLVDFFTAEPLLVTELVAATSGGVKLRNGSFLKTTTATYAGLSVEHPTILRLHDAELVHPACLTEALCVTVPHPRGYPAQATISAVKKVASGTAAKLLGYVKDGRLKERTWCAWEVLERCPRKCRGDATYGDCGAFERGDETLCGGRARDLGPGGPYQIDDFVKKARFLDLETVRRQFECREPSRPGRAVKKEEAA